MTEPPFPPHITDALDRWSVPPLPDQFHAGLMARLELAERAEEPAPPLAVLRPPLLRSRSWRHSGRIMVLAAGLGVATATAAASGFFGEPVYVPVVSDALAKAKLVDLPPQKPERPVAKPAAPAINDAEKPAAPAAVSGEEAVRLVLTRLAADPEYNALPRPARAAKARAEIKALLRSGKAQPADVKAAIAKLVLTKDAPGRETFRHSAASPDRPESAQEKRSPDRRDRLLTPAQKEKVRAMYQQLSPTQQAELRMLRQRLRAAPRTERPAIRAEIKAFWQRVGITPPASERNDSEIAAPDDVVL